MDHIIEECIEKGGWDVYYNYVARKMRPYTVAHVFANALSVAGVQFMKRDSCECVSTLNCTDKSHKWHLTDDDFEPVAVAPDACQR